ncbi:MAG: DUF11 domain-containing protein [Planctomycetes bacterium]|nr:DUF11 domain-containing protein [Planctomycetota bacterium]
MHRTEADRRSLRRAGYVCAVSLCALLAGCRSFYDPPGGPQANPFSGAPVAAAPIAGAPVAPPGAFPIAAPPMVGAPVAGPPAVAGPPIATGPPVLGPPVVAAPIANPPVFSAPAGVAPPVMSGPPALAGPPVVGGPCAPAIVGVPPVVVGAPPVIVGASAPGVAPPRVIPPGLNSVLTLTPQRMVAPVGSEVVLLAGMQTGDGKPLASERIEWIISPDSVGEFLAISNSGKWFVMPHWCETPRKITNTYAVGSTAASPVTLSRAPTTPGGVSQIGRGQSWITVTSPTDGTTHVTVFAPNAMGQARQRQTATIHWVDSQFSFPAPAIGAVGSRQALTTVVTRQSDGSPLENWIVRYEVTGGAPAGFAPAGAPSIEAITDAQGRATVQIFQPQPQRGASQINVEVIRPAAPGSSNRRLTIGRNCTTMTWSGADLGMRVAGPAQAEVGSTATYRIELVNSGDLAVNGVTINAPLPPGTRFVKSSVPPQTTTASLQWRIERVEPRQTVAIDVDLQIERNGVLEFCAMVNAQGGLQGRDCATTNVAAGGGLQVRISGPQNGAVGESVTFHLTVTNTGDAPVDGVKLSDTFDPGLKHVVAESRVVLDVGRLGPRQTRDDIDVTFKVVQPGRHCQRVEVSGTGARGATTQTCLTAAGGAAPASPAVPAPLPAAPAAPLAPGLEVRKQGPRQMKVGQIELFTLSVRNTGGTILRNVRIVDKFERGLSPTQATGGYTIEGGDLTWRFDSIKPGEEQPLQVAAQATADAPRACSRATVSADAGLMRMDETCVEIIGGGVPAAPPVAPRVEPPARPPVTPMPEGPEMPPVAPAPVEPARPAPAGEPGGLKVELTDLQDEVPVGRNVVYEVRVTNTRKVSDFQIVLSVVVPPGMTPLPVRPVAPTAATVTGQVIRFGAVAEVRPNEVLTYRVPVRADRAGRMRVEINVGSRTELQPIVASEETNVFSDN